MRSPDSLLQIPAAALACISEPSMNEPLHSSAICSQPLALPHLILPRNSKPAEILAHRPCKIGARTLWVEVLIAKPQRPFRGARALSRDPERPRMSEVKKSRWRWGKSPHVA